MDELFVFALINFYMGNFTLILQQFTHSFCEKQNIVTESTLFFPDVWTSCVFMKGPNREEQERLAANVVDVFNQSLPNSVMIIHFGQYMLCVENVLR